MKPVERLSLSHIRIGIHIIHQSLLSVRALLSTRNCGCVGGATVVVVVVVVVVSDLLGVIK